ncbi:hypothetical protein [Aureibacillus halotolerans]|uniref:Uncharacterized protein n=1 Tax=Aureibacillus halotolerans TaxID=1508390 RepID=A0A4R6UD12_9BACI|nr:hypothetical protein [Aureibacillus halotolerans]TDQ42655.1 hypothetical protein EV213_10184 [Aureibacillus halotolerans]
MGKRHSDAAWAAAKKRCRLNEADISMAKELGMTPKSLEKNIPSPTQQWKDPVKIWVRRLYEEKFCHVLKPNNSSATRVKDTHKTHSKVEEISIDEVPF